jgi:hypothetical protein
MNFVVWVEYASRVARLALSYSTRSELKLDGATHLRNTVSDVVHRPKCVSRLTVIKQPAQFREALHGGRRSTLLTQVRF